MESSSIDVVYGHVSHLPRSTLKQARWKSMSGLELSGFVNVKVPLRERKFTSWKAWKRQWCIISRTGNAVILQIGNDKCNTTFSVLIPEDAVTCRTESRTKEYAFGIFQTNRKHKEAYVYLAGESETDSQKWMSNIRCLLKPPLQSHPEDEFEISLIDNNHSRGAGLTGLYGNLSVTPSEILIKDTHTGKSKVTWHWSQINHSYLPLPANAEDVHRICTICTSSKFKTGEGELEIFCLQADKLHEKLSSCSRLMNIPKIVTQPLPPTPEPPPTPPRSRVNTSSSANSLATPPHPLLLSSRRMSRSENDLQKFFFGNSLNNLREPTSSKEFLLLSSQENVAAIKKVPSLIFANIGFLISTPGCSEPGSVNDLRRIGDSNAPNNEAQIPNNNNRAYAEKIEYEMIDEEDSDFVENGSSVHYLKPNSGSSISSGEYEEILDGEFDEDYKNYVDTPPPLPPRKSNNSSPSSEISNSHKVCALNQEFLSMMASHKPFDHKYLPMSNLKDKILVSGPIPL